jgi:hypothetical protein
VSTRLEISVSVLVCLLIILNISGGNLEFLGSNPALFSVLFLYFPFPGNAAYQFFKVPQSLWFSKSVESRHIQSKANWGKGYQFSPKGVSDFRFHTFRK